VCDEAISFTSWQGWLIGTEIASLAPYPRSGGVLGKALAMTTAE